MSDTNDQDDVLVQRDGHVLDVTINRPARANSYTPYTRERVEKAFADFESDGRLWVAVLSGAGGKAFCAGADLKSIADDPHAKAMFDDPERAKRRWLAEVTKPVVAAVEGACVGGGLELLLGTDIRIAAEGSRFGLGEVRWGLVPRGGAHVRLPQQVPWAVAIELILTGRLIDASRAGEIGLVNRVVEKGTALDEAKAVAETLCRNGPLAMRTAKHITVQALNLGPGFDIESELARTVMASSDAQEGPRAFVERREPKFSNLADGSVG